MPIRRARCGRCQAKSADNTGCLIEHFGNADAVPQLPERCLSRKAGIVWCCLNAFAAKSALSAFPFPGKIHPILPAFFDHTHFLGHCAKTWRFFQFACGYGCPLFFQRAYLPAQYMLYAVKLQGIYTAYSYLSVRATVDLPLPENSIHAILFQLRLLAQRLLFALTSKPQKDIYYISYKGKLSKKLPKRYK